MRLLHPASFFLSICLHAGVIALALFWPVRSTPPVDLSAQVIDIGIYTIGKPGAAPAAQTPPRTPSAPQAPTAPQPPVTPPTPATPPPDPVKPPQPQVKPDPAPVPIPPPDAPVAPPKPVEPPKPVDSPKPTEPATPATPARPSRPQRSADDIMAAALGDLSKGRTTDPDSADPDGDGSGGSGGDGIGLVGSYMQSLNSRIKPHWEYAGRMDRRNPTAMVRIRIARDGTIMDAVIETSSGDAAFDSSVVRAVFDTIRVEPPPTPELMDVLLRFALEAIRP